ncbi:MAG: sugar transferase [Desulfurella sp.]
MSVLKGIFQGFKNIEIIERDRNWGLANNIIDGVTKIVNEYGKIIVLEDDIETSPYFLKFMNEALEFYEDKEKVMHISGYMYPVRKDGLPDTFFIKPTSCWGWGTWKRAWQHFERNPEKQIRLLSKEQIKDFNLNNSYNYWEQVVLNYEGKLYTWAIFWYLTVYIKGGLSLHPRDSLARNIGTDEGTHFKGGTNIFDVEISKKNEWDFETNLEENQLARKRLEEYFNSVKPPLWRRIVVKILPDSIKETLKAWVRR